MPIFEKKPEWFPLIGGERTPKGQLCISNPDVVDRFVEWVTRSYQANPQLEVLGIEANDGHGWCECENCRAMDDPALLTPYNQVSMSPRVVKFNTEVARRLAELNPDAVVGWYIYSDHTEVPLGVEIVRIHKSAEQHSREQVGLDRIGIHLCRQRRDVGQADAR